MNQELHSSTSGVLQFPKQDLALPIDLTRDYLVGKCEYFFGHRDLAKQSCP